MPGCWDKLQKPNQFAVQNLKESFRDIQNRGTCRNWKITKINKRIPISIGENWVKFISPLSSKSTPISQGANTSNGKILEFPGTHLRPKHSPNHSSSYFEPNSSMASPWTHHHGSRTRLTCSKFQRVKKELNQNRRLPWGEAWSDQPLCCSGRSSWRGEEEELRQWLMERIAGYWIIGVGDGRPEMESSLRLIVCNWLLLIILID